MTFLDSQNSLGAGGAGLPDIATQIKLNGQNMAGNMQLLIGVLQAIFPRTFGTFTLAAAATTTVSEPSVASDSFIELRPTNAAAATLMGSNKALYVSAIVAGTSFTVATASGAGAVGTETFAYFIVSPV